MVERMSEAARRAEDASLVIANRNGERFLRQSIDSALEQTRATEVVVVDDGSTDASRELISSYGDRVVAVFKDWAGQASGINAGIAIASGSIVFLLDADDWSDPDRVSTIVPMFENDRELLWVRHNLRAVDDNNGIVVDELYSFRGGLNEMSRQVLREGKTPGTTSGLVFRKSYLENDGRIPEHYTTYPDSYLLIRGALVERGLSVEATLGAHRWHRGSSTSHHWREFEHAPFYLSLRKHLAEDASHIARRSGGPPSIARAETWWQLKANAEWRKSGLGNDTRWLAISVRFLRALISSELPTTKRLLLALRGVLLSMTPRHLFTKAWWISHIGRPSILRSSERERLT